MLQIFECLSKEGPSFMWTFFERKHTKYELRTTNLLQIPERKTNTYGVNSFVFKGALLWNTLPDTIKKCKLDSDIQTRDQKMEWSYMQLQDL